MSLTLWAVRFGNYEPAETDSLWWRREDAAGRADELDGDMWEVRPVTVSGVPPAVAVPRAVSRVVGCTCTGGGDVHTTHCGLRRFSDDEQRERIAQAQARMQAFALGVASWAAPPADRADTAGRLS